MTDSIPDVLTTARLRLRKPTLQDLRSIWESYAQDEDVTRYLSWRPHRTIEETRAFLRSVLGWWDDGSQYNWLIEEVGTAGVIGSIGFRNIGTTRQGGYVLAKPYWGLGYMTEALVSVIDVGLSSKDVFRFEALCAVENLASARVMEKAGMSYEGVIRRHGICPNIDAAPVDARCYSKVK